MVQQRKSMLSIEGTFRSMERKLLSSSRTINLSNYHQSQGLPQYSFYGQSQKQRTHLDLYKVVISCCVCQLQLNPFSEQPHNFPNNNNGAGSSGFKDKKQILVCKFRNFETFFDFNHSITALDLYGVVSSLWTCILYKLCIMG